VQYQRSLDVDRAAVAHPTSDWSLPGLARAALATDARLVLVIGTAYFVLAAWPLLFLRLPPYQDMPDHLATVSVLLHPERYPEYVSNGWLKANSLFVFTVYQLAKVVPPMAAGRLFATLVIGATAFALPRFVLAFTDRKRLLVASLVMLPMVHNWWTLMGMLNFAFAFPLGLELIVLLARQIERPTLRRGLTAAALSVVLWYAHAIILLLVGLIAAIEALRRPAGVIRRRALLVVLGPFAPAASLVLATIAAHALETTKDANYGAVFSIGFLDSAAGFGEAWTHWMLGISPLTFWTIVPAGAIVVWAVRRAREPIPMFSLPTLVVLGVLYLFLPCTMPGFGYVNERVLPMLWMWALVHVPPVVGPRLRKWLVACSALYAVSLPVELFAAEHAIDQFSTAAEVLPVGARVLTLNFPPDYSVLNTAPLFHASGMFTLLREAHPQDVWADSPSMPIRHAHPPTFADDPVLIREFAARSKDRKTYCKILRKGMRPTEDCVAQWQRDWTEFFAKARGKYDYVVLWNSTDDVMPMAGGDYAPVFERGKVRVYGRRGAAVAE
jgi:hypothetical protein